MTQTLLLRCFTMTFLVFFAILKPLTVDAQTFPSKPVKIIVPFAAGGLTDSLSRSVGELLSTQIGQPVLVDNRPGAAGHIAAELVAKGPADGYQIVLLGSGHAGGAAYSSDPIRYDLLKDFTTIGMLGFSPSLLIARKSLNIHNFAELVSAAKAKPGQLSFAGVQNYTGEYLEAMAGIDLNLILYRGAAQATNDLLGERVDLMVGTVSDMLQLMQSGKFNAIALNSPQRVPQLPGISPVAETIPGYRGGQWYGLFVPSRTPAPVVAKLRAALERAVKSESYPNTMAKLSMLSPERNVEQFELEVKGTLESYQNAKKLGKP